MSCKIARQLISTFTHSISFSTHQMYGLMITVCLGTTVVIGYYENCDKKCQWAETYSTSLEYSGLAINVSWAVSAREGLGLGVIRPTLFMISTLPVTIHNQKVSGSRETWPRWTYTYYLRDGYMISIYLDGKTPGPSRATTLFTQSNLHMSVPVFCMFNIISVPLGLLTLCIYKLAYYSLWMIRPRIN